MSTNDSEPQDFTSSPCSLHELESEPLPEQELLTLLNELIEGERAGTVGLLAMAETGVSPDTQVLLREVAHDEARFCSMLSHHVERLGGEANRNTGVFAEKLAKRESLTDKLKFMDKGQSAVVRMLNDAIPRIWNDKSLVMDLVEMRDVHLVNIERCNALVASHDLYH